MKLQSRLTLQVQKTDDYSEPDQISEVNDTFEAVIAPDVPTAEVSEEDHNASQQVIHSKNSFKYKYSHPEDQIIGNKDSLREQDHTSDQKSLLWDCCL